MLLYLKVRRTADTSRHPWALFHDSLRKTFLCDKQNPIHLLRRPTLRTTKDGGAGHIGVGMALAQKAIDWLALRIDGTPPAARCSNTSVNAGELPYKREIRTSIIDKLGVGDSKWIEKIKSGSADERFENHLDIGDS